MLLAALVLLLAQDPSSGAELRTLSVVVTDAKGRPVEGLAREEVAVLENGVARDVADIGPDRRPLVVVVIVDSSADVGSALRLSLVDAVTGFLRKLPRGTRYTLWTTGERPTRRVELTDDVAQAAAALRKVFPQGGSTLLDALVEAPRDLQRELKAAKAEGARTAVVALAGLSTEFSSSDRLGVVEQARDSADVFSAVVFEEREPGFEELTRYEYALGSLAKLSGGLYERVLSSLAVEKALDKVASDLTSRYRLSYATLGALKERRIEVQVARPGARVRVSPPRP
jgi:VWFA-related protein